MVINEVMKTFISPYKAGCVSQANPVFASSGAQWKEHGGAFTEESYTTVSKILKRYFLSLPTKTYRVISYLQRGFVRINSKNVKCLKL